MQETEDNITRSPLIVYLRVKPQEKSERQERPLIIVDETQSVVRIRHSSTQNSHQEFKFSNIFNQKATNQNVLFEGFSNIIPCLDSGKNATIMVYGITGSGKTHTIFGSRDPRP